MHSTLILELMSVLITLTLVILGKGKHTPPCSSEELFFGEKMGATEERFL